MKELITDIVGYEGKYQVTSTGRVFAYPNGSHKIIKELKQELNKRKNTTYKRVSLCSGKSITRFQVHRLVCIAFLKNPENKPYVNHIDNNGENNNLDNLEWCTHKENMQHSEKQGRQLKSHKAGGVATGLIMSKQAILKLNHLLGDRLISTKLQRNYKGVRRFVTFKCKHCNNTYTRRADSLVVCRGGICRDCN